MDSIDNYLQNNYTRDKDIVSRFLKQYDKQRKGHLTLDQFQCFVEESFDCSNTTSGQHSEQIRKIFQLLDTNKDGCLDGSEWKLAWNYWLKQVLAPVTALLVIDVQNDFISGNLALSGCPAGQDGAAVVPIINNIQDNIPFNVVVYSKDWHPTNHISFIDNVNLRTLHHTSKVKAEDACVNDTVLFEGHPVTEQILWPRHCVQGSQGAELHPDLKVLENSYTVNKGTQPDVDSYSAFWDNDKLAKTELVSTLAKHKVTDVYVCGLAYDVCVGSTALHAVEHGFRTSLIEDACRGVTLPGIEAMKERLIEKGVYIGTSEEIGDLVAARKRPLILARQAAENFALAMKICQSKRKNRT